MTNDRDHERTPTPDEVGGSEREDEDAAPDDGGRDDGNEDVETAAPTRGGSNVPNAGKDPSEGRNE